METDQVKFSWYFIFSVYVKFQKLRLSGRAGKCLTTDCWGNKAWFVVFLNFFHNGHFQASNVAEKLTVLCHKPVQAGSITPLLLNESDGADKATIKWASVRTGERENLGSTWEYLIHFNFNLKRVPRVPALPCFGFYSPPFLCNAKTVLTIPCFNFLALTAAGSFSRLLLLNCYLLAPYGWKARCYQMTEDHSSHDWIW